jgi:hypothetical protein
MKTNTKLLFAAKEPFATLPADFHAEQLDHFT